MASGISSTCTVHSGFEAVGRCKQCGKPFCSQCQVKGPTGLFCCPECKESHEAFTIRAQQLDSLQSNSTLLEKIKFALRKIISFALFILLVAVALHFFGANIPVVSSTIRSIMDS